MVVDVSGEGRGCNQLSGRFTVNPVTFDDDGALRTVSVTFEQHCEHMTPALRGTLEFRAGDTTPQSQPGSEASQQYARCERLVAPKTRT